MRGLTQFESQNPNNSLPKPIFPLFGHNYPEGWSTCSCTSVSSHLAKGAERIFLKFPRHKSLPPPSGRTLL